MSSSASPGGNPSRRSRAASKIINLAGLGSKSSGANSAFATSNTFPTFRFSPESDEIQEVLSSSVTYLPDETGIELDQISGAGNGAEPSPQSESLPSSPKPGETSPIKDYIRKNWTHKWDKKSLSLDLDLRGKIKTVIEDKRKSIVSHFIPEEAGLIPPLQPTTIQEHVHTGVESGGQHDTIFSYDNSTQRLKSNLTQQQNSVTRPSVVDEYEEIGVDFLACLENESNLEDLFCAEQVDVLNLAWLWPPPACIEKFEGVLTTIENQSAVDDGVMKEEDLTFAQELINFGMKLMEHGLTKVCIGLLAAAILLPVHSVITAFLTFVAGILCATVVSQTFSELITPKPTTVTDQVPVTTNESRSSTPISRSNTVGSFRTSSPRKILQLSSKSQGWMLEFTGVYNPHVITFHQTDTVFIRLDASMLYISTPSPKVRIPKRKLWNDPPLTHDMKFVRHRVYNLAGAHIFIAPERLASRRVWNKKYPIGIRLATPSYSWRVTRANEPSASTVPSPTETVEDIGVTSKEKETVGTASQPTFFKRRPSTNFVKGDKDFCRKMSDGKVFYLFSRTCREKEDWFRRLVNATKMNENSTVGCGEAGELELQKDYLRYMENILPNIESVLREGKPEEDISAAKSSGKIKSSVSVESEDSIATGDGTASMLSSPADERLDSESILTVPQSPMFLNALIGRLLYDAVRSPYWSLQLQNMIQRKLNFVKRPPFVELLIVKDLDLGGSFPIIRRASSPIIDSRGLWVDLDVTYDGNFCLTLEAKINLLKLRRSPTTDEDPPPPPQSTEENGSFDEDGLSEAALVGNLYDSDAEDSGESSEDEFDPEAPLKHSEEDTGSESGISQGSRERGNGNSTAAAPPAQPSKKVKLLKMVEKMATSNFVSEMKVVKSAIGKVANTPLLLTVEVKEMAGTISVNIPSPPTNRVWVGFRTKPEMKLITTPRVGERQVNLNPLTDWIQRKIHQQIQRSVVLPNMDDITIRLMEFKLPS